MTETSKQPEQGKDPHSVEELIKQAMKVKSRLKYSDLHKQIEMRDRSFGR